MHCDYTPMQIFGNCLGDLLARRRPLGALSLTPFLTALCLLSAISACAPVVEPVMGLRGPTRSVRAGADLARYHFQRPATWDIFDLGAGVASSRLERNALVISAAADLGYVTAGNNVAHTDVLINATVRQTRGLLGNGFGLLCRADKVGNGYWFLLSSRGEYSIQVAGDAREDPFPLVPWRYHSVIRQGLQANELRVVCAENYLALFVNDVFLAEAFDDEFRRGELAVALGATGREAGVSFDDIRLREARVTGRR